MHAPTDIHGESGLDGTSLLPPPSRPPITTIPAVDAAYEALIQTKPNTAWVVATGAFTNVAALFMKYPSLIQHVKGVSLMGGAIGGGFTNAVLGQVDGVPRIGNWTQFAEFNVLADPEAAQFIFSTEGLKQKTTLIPLDVTHLVLTTAEVRDLLLLGPPEKRAELDEDSLVEGEFNGDKVKGKSKLRVMLVELLMFFARTYRYVILFSLMLENSLMGCEVMFSESLRDLPSTTHWQWQLSSPAWGNNTRFPLATLIPPPRASPVQKAPGKENDTR